MSHAAGQKVTGQAPLERDGGPTGKSPPTKVKRTRAIKQRRFKTSLPYTSGISNEYIEDNINRKNTAILSQQTHKRGNITIVHYMAGP